MNASRTGGDSIILVILSVTGNTPTVENSRLDRTYSGCNSSMILHTKSYLSYCSTGMTGEVAA